jgi:riboflavin synthase
LSFEADVVRETLQATTLGWLGLGSRVNLERSLRAGDELGGHFVTGHIDGRGKIVKIEKSKRNTTLFIQAAKDIIARQAPKGSVAIDGISLTVQKIHGAIFEIAVIPHTLKVTSLGCKSTGSEVNIEIDIVARYVAAILGKKKTGPVSSREILKALLSQGL